MGDDGSILVTGAAGQLGAVGRTVTGLLLEHPDHHPNPAAAAALAQRAARIESGASMVFFSAPVSERLQLVRCIHTRRGTGLRPRMRNRKPSGVP